MRNFFCFLAIALVLTLGLFNYLAPPTTDAWVNTVANIENLAPDVITNQQIVANAAITQKDDVTAYAGSHPITGTDYSVRKAAAKGNKENPFLDAEYNLLL